MKTARVVTTASARKAKLDHAAATRSARTRTAPVLTANVDQTADVMLVNLLLAEQSAPNVTAQIVNADQTANVKKVSVRAELRAVLLKRSYLSLEL